MRSGKLKNHGVSLETFFIFHLPQRCRGFIYIYIYICTTIESLCHVLLHASSRDLLIFRRQTLIFHSVIFTSSERSWKNTRRNFCSRFFRRFVEVLNFRLRLNLWRETDQSKWAFQESEERGRKIERWSCMVLKHKSNVQQLDQFLFFKFYTETIHFWKHWEELRAFSVSTESVSFPI